MRAVQVAKKRFSMELPDGHYKEVTEEAARQRRTLQGQIQFIVDWYLELKRTEK